ncbi:hypothetical protein Peur_042924 [Populus x canadensis]
MESPAWLPRREVKPPPTSTEAGVAADALPLENSAGNNANSSCSLPAPTILDLVKDSLRNDPRYKSVKHEDREVFFNEYLSELKAAEGKAERDARGKREEQLSSTSVHDKLKERERDFACGNNQGPSESKPWLEKDPRRATNPDLDPSDIEKLFREHIKMLHERCTKVFKDLLAEVIIAEAAAQKTEDGKTVLDSWSTAKRLLKPDPRYNKMPRKERETLWRRYAEEMLRKQKSSPDQKEDRHTDAKNRSYGSPTIYPSYDIRGERRDPSVIRLHIIFQSFRSSRCLLDSTMIRPFKVASRIIGTKPSTRNMRGFHVAFVAPGVTNKPL